MKKFFALALLVSFTSVAYSMPPVKLTNDKTTAVALTGSDLLEKQKMQDCQLRLEGPPSDYRLAYSGGSIAVPRNAVKSIQDGNQVRVAVKGKIGNLSLLMLSLAYYPSAVSLREIEDRGILGSGYLSPTNERASFGGYQLLFAGKESSVERQLHEYWTQGELWNHRSHPNPNPGTLQFQTESGNWVSGGMYGIRPLGDENTSTTVDYNCVLRRHAKN